MALLGHRQVTKKSSMSPLSPAEDIGDDLALLAACNHTVLSYGTFGQWAALLRQPSQSAWTVMLDTADTDAALWNLIHSHKTVQVISMVAAATKEGRELWDGGLGPREAPRFGLYDRWTWLE